MPLNQNITTTFYSLRMFPKFEQGNRLPSDINLKEGEQATIFIQVESLFRNKLFIQFKSYQSKLSQSTENN